MYDRLSLYSDTIRSKIAAPSRPTTITSLTDVATDKGRRHPSYILIIGGAGGGGSIAIQLAKTLIKQSPLPSSFKLSLLSNHDVPNLSYQDDNNFFSINTSAL
jgi:hypothetical protein